MKIKTLIDAAADFRMHRFRHAQSVAAANPESHEKKEAAIEILRLALADKPVITALDNFPDDTDNEGFLCPICNDTGINRAGEVCVCFKSYIYCECYGARDINTLNESFEKAELSVYDDNMLVLGEKTQRDLMEMVIAYAKKYAQQLPSPNVLNLLINGYAGLGKTHLLRCIAKEAKIRGNDVMLIDYPDLHKIFHAHRMGESIDLSYINKAGVLILDDLGAEPATSNVSVEYLFDLINYRIDSKLPTVVATNVVNLSNRYTEPIASRLMSKETSKNFTLLGSDLRAKKTGAKNK